MRGAHRCEEYVKAGERNKAFSKAMRRRLLEFFFDLIAAAGEIQRRHVGNLRAGTCLGNSCGIVATQFHRCCMRQSMQTGKKNDNQSEKHVSHDILIAQLF